MQLYSSSRINMHQFNRFFPCKCVSQLSWWTFASSWDRPKLVICCLTSSSHCVFLWHPYCLIPYSSTAVQYSIQPASFFAFSVSEPSESTFHNHEAQWLQSLHFSELCRELLGFAPAAWWLRMVDMGVNDRGAGEGAWRWVPHNLEWSMLVMHFVSLWF